jgi:hypothetical protein
MIEAGTCDELKESILGNMAWSPNAEDLVRVKAAFVAQELEVTKCFITFQETGKGDSFSVAHTIKVSFKTKRAADGAFAKTQRAIRALRWSMCGWTEDTPRATADAIKVYSVEIRGHD